MLRCAARRAEAGQHCCSLPRTATHHRVPHCRPAAKAVHFAARRISVAHTYMHAWTGSAPRISNQARLPFTALQRSAASTGRRRNARTCHAEHCCDMTKQYCPYVGLHTSSQNCRARCAAQPSADAPPAALRRLSATVRTNIPSGAM
eukprot:TRINITY_DN1381_c0_g2_i7.p1 TRINITY_DN1381_c0_g2~~TRINITY_DN1381_c0_g2_i7.p1  ORF type:complete len:147 (+),score=15.40 TRINITY_DN1381_c0_g2_i7:1186-1626(+)